MCQKVDKEFCVCVQGNGLHIQSASETDTGVYVCHLDNFVQPVVTYKFTLFVEGVLINSHFDFFLVFIRHCECQLSERFLLLLGIICFYQPLIKAT